MPAKTTDSFASLGVDVAPVEARAVREFAALTEGHPALAARLCAGPLRHLYYHAFQPGDLRNPLLLPMLWQAALATPRVRALCPESRAAVLPQAVHVHHLDLHPAHACRPMRDVERDEMRLDAREDVRSGEIFLDGETPERLEARAALDLESARVYQERARAGMARAAELRGRTRFVPSAA